MWFQKQWKTRNLYIHNLIVRIHYMCVALHKQQCQLLFRFAGVMDRNEASALLEGRSNGTYLVRIRPHSNDKDKFALSLK